MKPTPKKAAAAKLTEADEMAAKSLRDALEAAIAKYDGSTMATSSAMVRG